MGNNLKCELGKFNDNIHGYDHVNIASGKLKISFERTVRVPDNKDRYHMPPHLGPSPLYSVSAFQKTLPKDMVKSSGVMFPRREAISIRLKATAPFAISVFARGINAISGKPIDYYRTNKLPNDPEDLSQDYIVVPKQKWLDGLAIAPGTVRQFIAMPDQSKYTVDAQLRSDNGEVSALGFEVVPSFEALARPDDVEVFQIFLVNSFAGGKTCALRVREDCGFYEFQSMVRNKTHIPIAQQRLVIATGVRGRYLGPGLLKDFGVKEGSTVRLVTRMRGGGIPPLLSRGKQMSIAPGGFIRQTIQKDHYDAAIWAIDSSISFDVNIWNTSTFQQRTGYYLPPSSKINAKEYARRYLPFYKEADNAVPATHGYSKNWENLKSVCEMDRTTEESQQICSKESEYRVFTPFEWELELTRMITEFDSGDQIGQKSGDDISLPHNHSERPRKKENWWHRLSKPKQARS